MVDVVVTAGRVMSPVDTIVRVEVAPIAANVRFPVPVKLTVDPATGAREMLPPTV